MKKFTLGPAEKKLSFISKKLVNRVLKEVHQRLSGKKKWCPNETLEQILLNQYTVIELEKNLE